MRYIGFICLSILSLSCFSVFDNDKEEVEALENIVLLRTEGLALVEKYVGIHSTQGGKDITYTRLKQFYSESHDYLLSLCANKTLNLSMNNYTLIYHKIEHIVQDSVSSNQVLVKNILLNLNKQKALYLEGLKDPNLASLHLFILDSYLQMDRFIERLSPSFIYKN